MPGHIGLSSLKVLVPKLHFCASQPWRHPQGTQNFIRELWNYSDAAVMSPPNEHLDEAIKNRVLPKLDFNFPGLDDNNNPFHFYHRAIERVQCAACAGNRPICSGNERGNDINVASPESCLSPVHTLFEVSEKVAAYFYGKYAPQAGYRVSLCTEHSSRALLHEIPAPYHVDARTKIYPDESEIVLTLNSGTFDVETFRAALYILFHECICHAFQGNTSDETRRRCGCSRSDYFCEGWMDYVATAVLIDFLNGEYPELQNLLDKISLPHQFLGAGSYFHEQRCNRSANPPNPSADAHWFGQTVAQMTEALLEDMDLGNFREQFLNLSFGINAAPTLESQRLDFVMTLDEQLEPHYRPNSPLIGRPEIANVFKGFVSHRNAWRLFEDVRSFG